jgi:hypothetical protein
MQLQRVATETHLAQKLGEKLGLAFAEHSQNTLIKQVHKSTTQNGFKTIIGHFRNSHARHLWKNVLCHLSHCTL